MGIYEFSEGQAAGYRGIWERDITSSAKILMRDDEDSYVARTNLDIAGCFAQVIPPTPVPTVPTLNSPQPRAHHPD